MQISPLSFFTPYLKQQTSLLSLNAALQERLQNDLSNSVPLQDTFINQCLEFLGEETEDNKQQFQIITLLHPTIVELFSTFTSDIQDAIRTNLLNTVIARASQLKSMGALGLLIRQIVQIDNQNEGGFTVWVDPLGELIKWMGSEEPGVSQAGIQFFIYFYKENTNNITNSQFPLYKLSSQILPCLFQTFASAPEEQQQKISLRQKILYLMLQVLKSFSFYDGSDDEIVKNCFEQNFQLWMSLFSSILKSSLTLRLGLKKYVIKILVIIYRDMNHFCQKRMKTQDRLNELLTLWEFAYKFIPFYLASNVWKIPYEGNSFEQNTPLVYFDDDYDSNLQNSEALAHNILEFISVISSSQLLSMIGKISIYHTINALFHYFILSYQEFNLWTLNFSYFINTPDHESMRGKILNTLNEIIERNADFAIQALLVISQKFLMNYSQAHTVENVTKIMESMGIREILEKGKLQIKIKVDDLIKLTELSGCDIKEKLKVHGQTWHKSEVALSILGRFAEDIIVFQSKQQGAFDIESFVQGLIQQFDLKEQNLELSFLKGQSLFCLTRFTEIISIKYKQLFCELVVGACSCVGQQAPMAVRLAACKTISIFLRKVEKHKLQLSEEQKQKINSMRVVEGIMGIELNSETNSFVLEALIEIVKNLGPNCLTEDITAAYLLENIHRNISHSSTLKICFNFFDLLCKYPETYSRIVMAVNEESSNPIIPFFIQDCLISYNNIVNSEQKNYLKPLDIDLILTVLKLANFIIEKCPPSAKSIISEIVVITPILTSIIESNTDLQIHIATTICLKSMIRLSPEQLKKRQYHKGIVEAIRCLLKIPADKTFEGASIYVGNLAILTFSNLLEKPDQEILQQVVLKVFKSRTPSVIQSLVLIYSKLMNEKTLTESPFGKGEWENKVRNIIDFLASFSIENRMGLKILVDKWLLQQSLFRGKYTKISTFMALSKLFLVRDKRIDNLLVIGFNPSHTNVNNDVNAPLKILATLIRCLKNQMGGDQQEDEEEEEMDNFQFKEEADKPLDVGLQKFKESQENQQQVGGLADRENQQGSTCYMSAMLEFYDDGEQCDETTQDDLIFLKDCSTKFSLKEYLTDFFLWLNNPECCHHQYFKQCLKQLLRDDLKTLQKYIKLNIQ